MNQNKKKNKIKTNFDPEKSDKEKTKYKIIHKRHKKLEHSYNNQKNKMRNQVKEYFDEIKIETLLRRWSVIKRSIH